MRGDEGMEMLPSRFSRGKPERRENSREQWLHPAV
jgi:hypothetical protein